MSKSFVTASDPERTLKNGDSFTFETIAGNFDCLATPTGTTGYADLIRDAETMDVDGIPVKVASLRDLIRMKRAAGRPRDLYVVEILEALRRLKS